MIPRRISLLRSPLTSHGRSHTPHHRIHTTTPYASHSNPLGLPTSHPPSPNLTARMSRNLPQKRPLPNVRKILAISSAKGGVGKSTIAANLALALARRGLATGLLDTDIYGPSVPTLFGTQGAEPELTSDGKMRPVRALGVDTMSMGYLIGQQEGGETPVAWRGLMVTKAIQQLLFSVAWGPTDALVLDLPPGTGDVQLSLAQTVAIDGAVLVTTPQGLAVSDTLRGLRFFEKTGVRVLGVVRNMSVFVCPGCGERTDVFGGRGEMEREVQAAGTRVVADVPLSKGVCGDADRGCPTVAGSPESVEAGVYRELAEWVVGEVGI